MKISNTLRISLALLASVVAHSATAQAPVTSLNASGATVKRLERMMEVRNNVQIAMQNQLATMSREIDELRGKLEKNTYELKAMQERQRSLYQEIDTLRQQAKNVSRVETSSSSTSESATYSNNDVENDQYNAAVDLILKKKNYNGAMRAFEAFAINYPKSVYLPNVYYWLGQLNLTKGELSIAKKHFAQVTNYKDSNKNADALLKLGVIAQKQNDQASATKIYKQVISQFPGTSASVEANNFLNK